MRIRRENQRFESLLVEYILDFSQRFMAVLFLVGRLSN